MTLLPLALKHWKNNNNGVILAQYVFKTFAPVFVLFFQEGNSGKIVAARKVDHQQTTGSFMAAPRRMVTHYCRRATAGRWILPETVHTSREEGGGEPSRTTRSQLYYL